MRKYQFAVNYNSPEPLINHWLSYWVHNNSIMSMFACINEMDYHKEEDENCHIPCSLQIIPWKLKVQQNTKAYKKFLKFLI